MYKNKKGCPLGQHCCAVAGMSGFQGDSCGCWLTGQLSMTALETSIDRVCGQDRYHIRYVARSPYKQVAVTDGQQE